MAVNLQLRAELPEDATLFDNMSYDGSIVGVTVDGHVVYDYDKMIEELMQDEGWGYEDAIDWIEYNTIGGRFPPKDVEGKAPIIMYPILK
jgi:hypothetical protein